jgi:cellobiose phosphorylase
MVASLRLNDRPGTPAVADRYGHFSSTGTEYCVTSLATPRPWANVIANPRMGLVVSHVGSGFTFLDNSQLAVLTRWQQDLPSDSSGKFLYLKDVTSGDVWSAAPAPVWAPLEGWACRHGLGYTCFEGGHGGIGTSWTLLVPVSDAAELWLVELVNHTDRPRQLELVAYLEWNMGVAPSPRREFGKLFLETRFDADRGIVEARNHMWEVPSERFGHWNTDFPYVAAFGCSVPLSGAQGDKARFLGRYGELRSPAALATAVWEPAFGRHEDAIAALRVPLELAPGEKRSLSFVLAAGATSEESGSLVQKYAETAAVRRELLAVTASWRDRLAAHRIATPGPTFDHLVNDWVRYQAISARLWARCGYYQQSGAFGFRDQLQDSQVWLTVEPERCRAQIELHAAHQFADGSVFHSWHPLSEQGLVTRMTDDLLWLAFVTVSYLQETDDFGILDSAAPFLDDPEPATLREHVRRAFGKVFSRISPRGLPLIGAGDWNDGLSAVGLQERGESVWLGHFLVGLLADWAEVERRMGDPGAAVGLQGRRALLLAALNRYGWDGAWYLRGTRDDGEAIGSASNREGRIYLNAQTWAVLNDVASPERAAGAMAAVKEHLVTEAGALLLAPAYTAPVPEIGTITRYAPGLRENGGVYTHAATWAIAAAAKLKDRELVGRLLVAIDPTVKDPERYWAEPYVLPGNVDGPVSPHHGRAGWTWYTGSAAWLHRVVTGWVLGVRPDWDGLRIDPCLPATWRQASMVRPFRGSTYHVEIDMPPAAEHPGVVEVRLDGVELPDNVIPPPQTAGERHEVRVRVG